MPADPRRTNNPPGSKREAARRRIAEKRAAEAAARAREARRRRVVLGGVAAAAVLVLAVVVVLIQSNRTATSPTAAAPAHTIDNGLVIPVGSSTSSGAKPIVVNLYEDLQCPNCKAFEAQSRGTLAQLVAQGKAVLHYHEMAFLDSSANDDFSTRALNAAAVVTNTAGDAAFQKFHDLIYEHQTPESGPAMTDQQLISYANQAGATGPAVSAAIKNLTYKDWTKKVTDQASKDGVTQTPTVIIGGKQVKDLTPAGITAAVNAAANG